MVWFILILFNKIAKKFVYIFFTALILKKESKVENSIKVIQQHSHTSS